ncbi:MAG: ribosome silencing factor [Gemmataceae bacterium]
MAAATMISRSHLNPGATAPRTPLPTARKRACLAAKIAVEDKGQDVVVLDMRKVTPLYDFFVIATGASRRQVHAICEDVDEALRKVGDTRMGIEGYEASKWVVQDYGDVMLHVFDPDSRAYYTLEELWNDAKKIDWEVDVDAEEDDAEEESENESENELEDESEPS